MEVLGGRGSSIHGQIVHEGKDELSNGHLSGEEVNLVPDFTKWFISIRIGIRTGTTRRMVNVYMEG